jgi:hypothetical protein
MDFSQILVIFAHDQDIGSKMIKVLRSNLIQWDSHNLI